MLEIGPVLKEENTHKVKRETLHEEGSRLLATAARMAGVSAREAALAMQGMRNIDNSLLENLPGATYIEPVDYIGDLPNGMPTGSMCFVHERNEMWIYIGNQWTQLQVERNPDGSIERAHATVLNERIDRQN